MAGFIAGIALQLQQPALWLQQVYAACALLACVAAWLFWRFGRRAAGVSWARAMLAFGLAVLLGFGSAGWRAGAFQAGALDPALEGRDIEVTGSVLAMPQQAEDGLRFRLGIDSARLDGRAVTLPPHILLGWYSGFAGREPRAQALDADPFEAALALQRQPQPLRAGERWRMTVRLKAPHGNSNPHGFDYELWLWEQGIQATGYVRAGASDAPPTKLSSSWRHPIEQARQSVRDAIFERVSDRQWAGVIAALVVGDQNAIERADWDVFRATGVAHLMSISGLHITMFAWVASLLISGLWRRSARLTPSLCLALPAVGAGALGGLLLATLYALFSGWGVPAQRTIWMLATVVLLRQGGRQWPWAQTWLLAMAVVVAIDPWALMQAGFWLSFVAVGVLFATDAGASDARGAEEPVAHGWRRHAPRWLAGLARAAREQWVVTLALTPLSLLLFNQVSLVGLLANAVAIPAVTLLITPLALLGVLWAPAWQATAGCVSMLALFLQWLASWPFASISVAAAPLWCAVAGVAGGALLATRLPWHWRALGIPLLLPVLLWQPPRVAHGQFELLAADIGQGNAVLVRTAGHSLLYDAGPRFSRESDAGHRVLVPLLRALGERLDILMVSHRDIDHIGGAAAVLAMQPGARFLSSIEDTHPLQALRKVERCMAGQRWEWDGVRFEVLHPAAGAYDALAKPNAMSCVLRISTGSRTALLVGDIEAPQELALATSDPARLKADFLLVPHHGSKTSSTTTFLDAVQPQWAVAQAGYRNRFGHPAEAVAARYEARGIHLVKSPPCGAAMWDSQNPDALRCQREEGKRYWHHVPVR
ncbi:DNA internalization-related competence protein ComEC/Rec2 [Polaromonas sp. YR568]|uniref:DNA internalization-related competence protein ComEC/Rec2 n=1 Tax=Polaromonas sp. YR568 TaxID=1855301 RepID=UPI00398BD6DE